MKDYLKKYQPILYKTLTNFKENNIFSQAILINGSNDAPLLDICKYIAQTIVCNDKTEACLNCINCSRIEDGNYPDLILIDGEKEKIKKGYIEDLQSRFSKSSLEGNQKIYIINYIENSTKEAINSLLKFLEEPEPNIYAILSCGNINSVLPTIVSRCQNLHLKNIEKNQIIVEANQKNVPLDDCFILSYFCGNEKQIIETYDDLKYKDIKDITIEILNKMNQEEDLLYFAQIELNDIIKEKNDFKMLLQLLEVAFFDIINSSNDNLHFLDQKELLIDLSNKIKNKESKLEKIMLYKNKADSNVNLKLLIDSLFLDLKGE